MLKIKHMQGYTIVLAIQVFRSKNGMTVKVGVLMRLVYIKSKEERRDWNCFFLLLNYAGSNHCILRKVNRNNLF